MFDRRKAGHRNQCFGSFRIGTLFDLAVRRWDTEIVGNDLPRLVEVAPDVDKLMDQ